MKENSNIYFLQERNDLDDIKDEGGMLIVTASSSMDVGYGKDLFRLYVADENNDIIVTDRGRKGSFMRHLLETQPQMVTMDTHLQVDLTEEEKKKVESELKREHELRLEKEQRERVLNKSKMDDDQMEDDASYLFLPPGQEAPSSVFLLYPYQEIDRRDPRDPDIPFGIQVDTQMMRDRRNQLYNHDDEMQDEQVEEEEEEEEDFFAKLDKEYEDVHRSYKFQKRQIELDIDCTIRYIDFCGRSGRVATREMCKKIRPHNTIIVNGPKQFSNVMKRDIQRHCSNINVPTQMEIVSLELHSTFYEVKLNSSLFHKKEQVRSMENGFNLRFIDGAYNVDKNDDVMEDEQETPVTADVRPTNIDAYEISRTESKWHAPIFVSNNRFGLGPFKTHMEENYEDLNFHFENMDGSNKALVCNSKVYIVMMNEEITVDSRAFCKEYFLIRNALYTYLNPL
eukprot:CAMPEP_0117422414 /NCGR_PEP_ID=MMETSP0758-20121206/3258_1 /TAXON_ID=63605 /ORGANISM="Percolomonas cosmopolitus, Strain AE-1 (ATCC 50343)" /LENGTH=452 /DNA_ID=CAMNT_0005205019 /DNA_START=881 /DNA_END=2239 /DNA_ORIENTATION=+